MRDCLLDIMKNTCAIEQINLLKITGTKTSTTVEAIAENNSVILQAKLKNPMPEFADMVIGLPNISKLRSILGVQEYKENGTITLTWKTTDTGTSVPDGLQFNNERGDFTNTYRFMGSTVVAEKSKSVEFNNPPKWVIDFEPTNASIIRFKTQAFIHKEETNFKVGLVGSDLIISFGDHSNHAGKFVIQQNVKCILPPKCLWPVSAVLEILALSGSKRISISSGSLLKITVDTDLCTYNYLLPAQG